MVLPSAKEGFGANLFSRDEVRALADELRDTKAGRPALRMYAEERATRLVECVPPLDRTRGYRLD